MSSHAEGQAAGVGAPALSGEDPSLLAAEDVVQRLSSHAERGLSTEEARARAARHGKNELTPAAAVPKWRKLLGQLADPLIYLLLGAVVVSFVAWIVEGAHGWPFEALAVLAIILANAVLGYVEEAKAEQAVAALQRMTAATASVVRDGQSARVPAAEVVPGDLLLLAEGDAVAADARLLSSASLKVAEASLTGESEAVVKESAPLPEPVALGDRVNMVWKGTAVAGGVGRAVVTGTGMATEMGRIARLLESTKDEPTPLEREVARVGRTLGLAVIAIAVVVVATVLIVATPQSASGVVGVLLLGVSLAVAAVPEGLPAVLSVVLAVGVQRMAKKRAIVKKLSSVETLGSTSVVCTDKTGTLTRNEMTLERVLTHAGEVELTGSGFRPEGQLLAEGKPLGEGPLRTELELLLGGGGVANGAELTESEGEWHLQGDPTDGAFLAAERKAGLHEARAQRFRRVGELPFSSERKLMSVVVADSGADGRQVVFTKGAPDVLLGRCANERAGADTVPLTPERREEILKGVERLSDQALRTIAVATRALGEGERLDLEAADASQRLEQDLTFLGTAGIIDPPRTEAAAAIREAHAAGVRVIMITGDHPRTAARIAENLGIVESGAAARTGLDLDRLDDAGFRQTARDVSVFARVAPDHKLRIVDALQAEGAIVAMTGDGVNDAPALKSADIGIAMGITGTEVTKQAAKMILADDNFATIIGALREGRLIFDNIKKFLRYLLSSNTGEVFTVFFGVLGAALLGLEGADGEILVPLLATQILWINLLTDAAPALALGVDRPTEDVMARPPRSPEDRIIDRGMQLGVVGVGAVMALATLFTLDLKLPGGLVEGDRGVTEARTAAFTVLVFAQLFNCLNARSERRSAFVGLFRNPWLWGAIALSVALQLLVVMVPFMNRAFSTTPLSLGDWGLCAAIASSVLWVEELKKAVLRARGP